MGFVMVFFVAVMNEHRLLLIMYAKKMCYLFRSAQIYSYVIFRMIFFVAETP